MAKRNEPDEETFYLGEFFVGCEKCNGTGHITSDEWIHWVKTGDMDAPKPPCPMKYCCPGCGGRGFFIKSHGKSLCRFLESLYPGLKGLRDGVLKEAGL